MRMNYSDIKQEIADNWEQFESNQYPEDLISEFADSATPIYYGEIIRDWQEMPSEFGEYWKEVYGETVPENVSITDLMSADLYNYYRHTYQRAYNELADTMPAKESVN